MTRKRSVTVLPCVAILLVSVCVAFGAEEIEQQSVTELASLTTREHTSPIPVPPSSLAPSTTASDLREAFASTVLERNRIRVERDTLKSQTWFILLYAIILSGFTAWLGHHLLRLWSPVPTTGQNESDRFTDAHARANATTRSTLRKNATITIRNGKTQLPEMTAQVATRRFFVRPSQQAPKPSLMPHVLADQLGDPALPHCEQHDEVDDDYAPSVSVAPQSLPSQITRKKPVQSEVHSDPQPDYYSSDHSAKNGSVFKATAFTSHRIKAFSLLEIVISVAVLTTVLMAVGSGIMSLSTSQKVTREDTAVHELLHICAERIMGGDWEWLGREHSEDTSLSGAWSWQREQNPDPKKKFGHPPLQENSKEPQHDLSLQLLDQQKSGVANLRFYLEYYRSDAVTESFSPTPGYSATQTWNEARLANRMSDPIDLRQYNDAVVVRLAATWNSTIGGQRSHELIFARRR